MGECLILRRGGEHYELPVLSASQPQDAVRTASAAGASASFSVVIETPGQPAEYSYQWYENGRPIAGATGASCTRSGLRTADTRTLYCVVTNKAGSVTSRTATLTVQHYTPTYTYSGNAQLVDDGSYNWRIKFLTSGVWKPTRSEAVDVFLVGGGGGGAIVMGGGGGYTATYSNQQVTAGTSYTITVGAGGAAGANGGDSYALGKLVGGGCGAPANGGWTAGDGGSGGGSGNGARGGTDGGAGEKLSDWSPGAGQGSTTREFGAANGKLYASGGSVAAHLNAGVSGAANTGDGGGGSGTVNSGPAQPSGAGGSGIIIIRNHR